MFLYEAYQLMSALGWWGPTDEMWSELMQGLISHFRWLSASMFLAKSSASGAKCQNEHFRLSVF